MQKSKNIYSKVNFKSIKYYEVSNSFLSENNQRNVNDVLSVTDNEATRPTFVRMRPALHEAENEAEAEILASRPEHPWFVLRLLPDSDLDMLSATPKTKVHYMVPSSFPLSHSDL